MSQNSRTRDLYFEKVIKPQPTPKTYLNALATSPYRTHRRMAVALLPEMERLLAQRAAAMVDKDLEPQET